MFTVVAFMGIGIICGYFFRKKDIRNITSRATTLLIWLLLFVLGIEVGSNKEVIENLTTIGIEALLITFFSTLGSCIAAAILWRLIVKKKGD